MGSTLRKRGKEDQNQRMGAQKNQRAGPPQSPGSSSLLSKTLLPIVVISLFYLHFLQPDLSPFNWIQNLATSITEFSVRDSLNLALRPPTKSFAICSFGSYPPSKSSSTAIARIYTVDQAQEETHGENGATHCMVVKDEKIHILTDGEGVENWCDGKNCDVRVLDVSVFSWSSIRWRSHLICSHFLFLSRKVKRSCQDSLIPTDTLLTTLSRSRRPTFWDVLHPQKSLKDWKLTF